MQVKYIEYKAFSVRIEANDSSVFAALSEFSVLINKPHSETLINIKINSAVKGGGKEKDSYESTIRRFGRTSFQTYKKNNSVIDLDLAIPNCEKRTVKLISSQYQNRKYMALSDFFYGPYLGLLGIVALKNDALLLHASCINLVDKSLVIIGRAKSGKTYLAKELSTKLQCSVVADDMLILTKEREIVPIQIPIRESLNVYLKTRKSSDILERINIIIFRILRVLKISHGHRRITYGEYFSKSEINIKPNLLLFYLNRGEVEGQRAATTEVGEIFLNEIENMPNFQEIINWMGGIGYLPPTDTKAWIKNKYNNIVRQHDIKILWIPYLDSPQDFVGQFITKTK